MAKTRKIKKYFFLSSLILAFFFSLWQLFFFLKSEASTKLDGIENFPESYQPYLREIAKKHLNWSFRALYTNLDWTYVINQENQYGKNLVPINYSDSWKNMLPGQYNVEVDSGWVDSSRQAVEYSMDPRNFLNEGRLFQFETLSYESSSNSLDGVEKILYGTEFYNTKVSYLTASGSTVNMAEKYSDLILKAGKTSKVSPYHLSSRIKQEVGPFLSHSSISGKVEGYKGYYNFYNIGATSSSEPMGAIKNGLRYAKDGNGASETTKTKYLIPWNTKEKAITGGAIFIGSSYINVGQNTIYLQKFDVNDDRKGNLFTHQYMTNVLAPSSEAKSIYNGYQKSGLLNTAMTFLIPVYNNMPEIQTQSPNINKNDFTKDNTKAYCNTNEVNVRTGPSTSYEVITTISKNTKMTILAKGKQTGERWDMVILENGIVGYIYQTYVTEEPEIQIEKIEVTGISIDQSEIYMEVGDTFQINATIMPDDADDKTILYSSANEDIASVEESGIITAKKEGTTTLIATSNQNSSIKAECILNVVRKLEDSEIHFDSSLTVNSFEISGIDYTENTVANLKEKIITDLEVEIVNFENKVLKDTDKIGTGSKVLIKENGEIIREYQIIIYGDVDGSGKIDSVDLLVLQRHILEIKTLEPIFRKAANIDKSGSKPTSVDLLLIQRHILELQIIKQ